MRRAASRRNASRAMSAGRCCSGVVGLSCMEAVTARHGILLIVRHHNPEASTTTDGLAAERMATSKVWRCSFGGLCCRLPIRSHIHLKKLARQPSRCLEPVPVGQVVVTGRFPRSTALWLLAIARYDSSPRPSAAPCPARKSTPPQLTRPTGIGSKSTHDTTD